MPPDHITPDIWFPNLGIYFENVPKVLISPFGFDIYMYAVCIVLGIIAAYIIGMRYVKKTEQNVEVYTDLLVIGVPFALVGLRVYYLAFNWDMYSGQSFLRVFFNFRDGGLAIFGGIIGSVLAAFILSRRRKILFTVMADTAIPSFVLGQVIGRFGNFFNREAFGGYTDNLFAMRIRVDQTPGTRHITDEIFANIVRIQGAEYYQVHPTFFYEAFFNFLLFLAMIIYRPHKRFDGEIVLYYFLGYGVIRFFVERLRTDQMIFLNTGLPLNQMMAALVAAIAAGLLIAGHSRAKNRR